MFSERRGVFLVVVVGHALGNGLQGWMRRELKKIVERMGRGLVHLMDRFGNRSVSGDEVEREAGAVGLVQQRKEDCSDVFALQGQ